MQLRDDLWRTSGGRDSLRLNALRTTKAALARIGAPEGGFHKVKLDPAGKSMRSGARFVGRRHRSCKRRPRHYGREDTGDTRKVYSSYARSDDLPLRSNDLAHAAGFDNATCIR